MATGLPSMAYGDGISKRKQVKFGGYNHTLAAENGDLWDMENLTSDFYPLLSPRTRRWTCRTLTKPNGLYAHDGLYWADGTGFYADGELKGIVTDGHKKFTSLGAYIVILPDKKYYNRLTGDFGALESSWSGSAKIQDGTYAGEEAKANTIYAVGAGAKFNEGDAVRSPARRRIRRTTRPPLYGRLTGTTCASMRTPSPSRTAETAKHCNSAARFQS